MYVEHNINTNYCNFQTLPTFVINSMYSTLFGCSTFTIQTTVLQFVVVLSTYCVVIYSLWWSVYTLWCYLQFVMVLFTSQFVMCYIQFVPVLFTS